MRCRKRQRDAATTDRGAPWLPSPSFGQGALRRTFDKSGSMAVGFGTSPNGSWSSVDRTDWSGFYDDALQGHLLNYFTVDGVSVDPYDGATFCGPQLDTLITRLQMAAQSIATQPPEWPFADEEQRTRYFESCRQYQIDLLQPRDQALRILREAIALATKARNRNEFLTFCGD